MPRDLKADLELIRKATPGPWEANATGVFVCAGNKEICFNSFHAEGAENNIAFIAAAREGWPEAIRRALAAEERVETLQSAIARAIDRLQKHEHEDVYGPYGFAGTQCIVHDSKLCEAIDDLQAVLDKGEEG